LVLCTDCGGSYCMECEEETSHRDGYDNCVHVDEFWRAS
jgi:hypothetical protein